MTLDEFNNKQAKYLQERFYGLSIEDDVLISFLGELFQILTVDQNFLYQQNELKFESPRLHTNLDFGIEQ